MKELTNKEIENIREFKDKVNWGTIVENDENGKCRVKGFTVG